ncbi:MAG: hypothetical protein CL438_04710 [Acidimicrobiaceae bacterium]|nr:hypothetical protein [Acidimicrobiaceae bacterium]|tara:strand:- start:1621 stop:1869 length:249 start_codon:yes stop_codon:yes gene_type:complete
MEDSQPSSAAERLKKIDPKYFGGVISLVVLLLFVFQNTEKTQVEFLWFDIAMPLFLLLVLTSVLASLIALLLQRLSRKRRSS